MNKPENCIQPFDEHISVSGQLSAKQIEQLSPQGFRAVMNLRSYQEEGADQQDQQRVESLGLTYANVPIRPGELTREITDNAIQTMHKLPKPLLVYCGSALRATFMSLLYSACDRNLTLEEMNIKGRSLGFEFEDKSAFNRVMEAYAKTQSEP